MDAGTELIIENLVQLVMYFLYRRGRENLRTMKDTFKSTFDTSIV